MPILNDNFISPSLPPSLRSSSDSSSTHDYILLRAEVSAVKDVKKPYSIRLACKGVREIFLAADEEEDQINWILKLEAASRRGKPITTISMHY